MVYRLNNYPWGHFGGFEGGDGARRDAKLKELEEEGG